MHISVEDQNYNRHHRACFFLYVNDLRCMALLRLGSSWLALFFFFFLKQPQEVRRSWIRRGSQWHVLYPTASQDVEWADESDHLPGIDSSSCFGPYLKGKRLEILGNFSFLCTVNILPPLPTLSCSLRSAFPPLTPLLACLLRCLIFDADLTVYRNIKESRPTIMYPDQQDKSGPIF